MNASSDRRRGIVGEDHLPWTLRSSLLIWAAAVWALFTVTPGRRPVAAPPIFARLVEEPAPAPKQIMKVEKPVALHKFKPQQITAPLPSPVAPGEPSSVASTAGALPVQGGVRSAKPSANGDAQAVTPGLKGGSGGGIYANSGARAIIRPMPQIPDELREEAFNSSALARFHVAADGSATVELARPTPDPRLNRILLYSLRKWKFMPAIKDGKPAASTEEIVIKIEVK